MPHFPEAALVLPRYEKMLGPPMMEFWYVGKKGTTLHECIV